MQDKRRKQTVAAVGGDTRGNGRRFIEVIATSLGENGAARMLALKALGGIGYAAVSFLFGRTSLMLDTYPLGIALLCASDRYIAYIFAGALASVFTVVSADTLYSPFIYVLSYAVALAVRLAARVFIDTPQDFSLRGLVTGRMAEKNKSKKKITSGKPKQSDITNNVSRANGASKLQAETLSAKVGITPSAVRKKQLLTLYAARFTENIYLRMATSCVTAFIISLFNMSAGGYRYYDLFAAMFAMVSAPAFVFLFAGFFSREDTKTGEILYKAAVLGLLFSITFSLCGTNIFGINVAVFAAFSVTLYFSCRDGILVSSFAALVCGLAVSPIYIPVFVLAAIASGLFWTSSSFASVSVACTVGMLWGVYIDGFNAFTTLLPALLSSSLIICTLATLSLIPESEKVGQFVVPTSKKNIKIEEQSTLETFQAKSAEEKMKKLSETFSALSSTLYELSDRMRRPGQAELRTLCESSCELQCRSCNCFGKCYSDGYGETSEMIGKLTGVLENDGRINEEKLPDYVKERCTKLPDIIIEINTRFAELIRRNIVGEKTELFALDYDAVSHILSDAIEAEKLEYEPDDDLCAHLAAYARRPEVGMKGVMAYGTRKKHIYARDIGRRMAEMGADDFRHSLEEICEIPLAPLLFEIHDGRVSVKTESARRFSIKSGKAVLPAGCNGTEENDAPSGDSVSLFENGDDYFYSLISDGMGSGEGAAQTSGICEMFLTKMLEGGNKKETALKMLNTLLRSKNVECSATVDLMEVDLIKGQASFVKSGAAPSFVRRGDKLFKLRSRTFPIGIMRVIDAEQVKFDLMEGDIIIMISDGISQCPEESVWLMEMLGGDLEGAGLSESAKMIAERARKEGSRDDLSVALVKVEAA